VDAGTELLHHVGVAHAARAGDLGAEGLGFGGEEFVGTPVAQGTIRRAFIPSLAGEPVGALGVVARLIGVAVDAGGFFDVSRMRILIVFLVAGVAGEGGVGALGKFIALIVAGDALRLGRFGRRKSGGGD
jgi:hypothetical protein